MIIDLPQCSLNSCRYEFDGNCTIRNRYKGCEFAHFKELEANGRLIELPCKVGDTVYEVLDLYFVGDTGGEYFYTINERKFELRMLDEIGKCVFLTKEEAEAKLAELKGE